MSLYRIGELSRLAGVSPRTIDYYTRLGLLVPVRRTSGSHRLYDDEALHRLGTIRTLQRQKMTLEEIRAQVCIEQETADWSGFKELSARLDQLNRELTALCKERPWANGAQRSAALKTFHGLAAKALAMAQTLLLLAGEIQNL
ncbi:MAG: MerR family transcriptional regulator [Firmicutes bacterium]|nr:MerR family transcriptional regulator [Bacillota bacterium]